MFINEHLTNRNAELAYMARKKRAKLVQCGQGNMDHENRRGSAVAIYVKNCIEFDVMEGMRCAVGNLLECISINVRVSIKKLLLPVYIDNQIVKLRLV